MEGSGSLSSLRELNRGRVIESLRELGVASRAEIARSTGLSPATVSTLVGQLVETGLVVDAPQRLSRRSQSGRPPALITLDPSAGVAIGIDFGKRHLAVAVSDLSHEILAERWRTMHEDYDARAGMDGAVKLVDEALTRSGTERDRVLGVGLGLPGPIHRSTGTVGSSAILPGWTDVRIAEVMSERLALPVHVDNDANLGALGEMVGGAGQGCAHLVYLNLSNGVGAGIVADGQLYRGAGGIAGEVGHITVDERGPVCRCGNRGCLETLVGGPYLLQMLPQPIGQRESPPTVRTVIAKALAGDPGCRRILSDAGRAVGNCVAILANLFNPRLVILGGELARAGDLLLPSIRQTTEQGALPGALRTLKVVRGKLDERAQVVGALALGATGVQP